MLLLKHQEVTKVATLRDEAVIVEEGVDSDNTKDSSSQNAKGEEKNEDLGRKKDQNVGQNLEHHPQQRSLTAFAWLPVCSSPAAETAITDIFHSALVVREPGQEERDDVEVDEEDPQRGVDAEAEQKFKKNMPKILK